MYELRPYQNSAVSAAFATDNGIIVTPTGGGKSLCVAGIVNGTNGKTLVLQPTKEILESNYEKIVASGFEGATIFSASVGVKEVGCCTYATIGSIIHKLDLFSDVDTLIIDEVHLVGSKEKNGNKGQYRQLIEALAPKRLIGLTATPYRLHTTSLGSDARILSRTRPKMFERIIHITQTSDLVEQGFLMRPEYKISGREKKNLLKLNSTGAEFDDRSVQAYLDAINVTKSIVESAKEALSNGFKHLLVFVPSLRESAAAVAALNEAGISADSISSESSKTERKTKLAKIRSGEIKAMVNVQIFTVGYDFPALDCIISARPTQSLALYYQIIGRCVRPHPSKSRPVVYDLVDNFSRFDDPMNYHIVESAPGLYAVLSPNGRLTNRIIGLPPEKDDKLEFGKYKGTALCQVPVSYISWYLENAKKSGTWHMLKFEMLRRQIFYKSHVIQIQPQLSL